MNYVKLFEQFILEMDISDKELSEKIEKFYELQNEIDQLKSKVSQLSKEMKNVGLEDDIEPIFESMKDMGDRLAVTEKHVVKISRYGGETKSYKYKEAFELALSKVNGATEKILNEALEATKKTSKVKYSFTVDSRLEEGRLSNLVSKIKTWAKSFLNLFKKEVKEIDSANKDLESLSKQI